MRSIYKSAPLMALAALVFATCTASTQDISRAAIEHENHRSVDNTMDVSERELNANRQYNVQDLGLDIVRNEDVVSGSYGRLDFKKVNGNDDRKQVCNTNEYPWRAQASLRITARDGSILLGTGWFACPNTLITAGHVLYPRNRGEKKSGWVKRVKVMPGRNGVKLPYGHAYSTEFHSVKGWTEQGKTEYDYGAIKLKTDMGKIVGWLGHGVFSDSNLTKSKAYMSGYPVDKSGGTQWYELGHVVRVTPKQVFHSLDTAGGQSGSALYRYGQNGDLHAFAVHTYGGRVNFGTRITEFVHKNIVDWCHKAPRK